MPLCWLGELAVGWGGGGGGDGGGGRDRVAEAMPSGKGLVSDLHEIPNTFDIVMQEAEAQML